MLQNRATLQQTRFYLLKELRQIYSELEAESIARIILEHTGFKTNDWLMDPQKVPGVEIMTQINEIVTDIHTGKPIQYILGYTRFCDLKLTLNEHVLIPRPETEEMVLKIIDNHPIQTGHILDVGTGSGCIALALKAHFTESAVSGMDLNLNALETAANNGRLNGLDVKWFKGDMRHSESWSSLDQLDMIASNPPYVLRSEGEVMQANVLNFEPGSALFVEDSDPLEFYDAIAKHGIKKLNAHGTIWVEINERFGAETAHLFAGYGFRQVTILKDIHEKERFIRAEK